MSTSAQRIEAKLLYLSITENAQKPEECVRCGKLYHLSKGRKQIGWYVCPACTKK